MRIRVLLRLAIGLSLLALCLPPVCLIALPAWAGTNDILIGLDEKIVFGPDGPVNGPPGKDAVVVLDISNPAQPRIRATLPLMNSLLGPPTNLQSPPTASWALSPTRW